ncbi:sensor histidine kinase [Metabacillus endolithicus]|uniref:Sensor histidine kinase n=1 Tax=Metabacillus endolithicus TaxID=1535204 RepID=A0ABW5BRH5_9BACI|nr:sensor histidine kinase [Metabacillus endolithicus]UPG63801.1 histidine kinase [Metabacillus endolithicus]
MKLKTKILLVVAIIISSSLLLSGIFIYSYFSEILIQQVKEDESAKLEERAESIQSLQNDIKQFSQYILVDHEIQDKITSLYSAESIYEKILNEEWLSNELKSYLLLNDYLDSIILVSEDGNVISSKSIQNDYYINTLKEKWFNLFLKREVYSGFSEEHLLKNNQQEKKVISYIVKFNPLLNPDSKLKYLIVNIDTNHLSSILKDETRDDIFYLFDSQNSLLYPREHDEKEISSFISENSKAIKIVENTDEIMIINPHMEDNWKIVSVNQKEAILEKVNFVYYFIAGVTILNIILIMIVLTPMILNISKPISTLARAMKEVSKGKLETFVDIKSGDEFEVLGEGFNYMVKELQKYIERSIEDEKIKQRLHMDLLISQINPHFIYNTLNTVIYIAQKHGNEDIVKITESFISLLQDTVKYGEGGYFVTVEEEVNNVKNYLIIQNYRYPNRFEVIWQLDSDILNVNVPRTILQPLVENALFHGIIPDNKYGTILIKISSDTNILQLIVSDDGVGMSSKRLKEVKLGKTSNQTFSSMRSIGLSNIKDRVLSFYENKSEFTVESYEGVGTKITMKIPSLESPDFIQ